MAKPYTQAEQKILLQNEHIINVSNTTVKFNKSVIKHIIDKCKTTPEIRVYLNSLDIEVNLLHKSVIKTLYKKYVSNCREIRNVDMSKNKFTPKQIKKLNESKVITKVTDSQISFTKEFKITVAKADTLTVARHLFESENIDISLIGEGRFEKTYYRLRNTYKKYGEAGFATEKRGRKPSVLTKSYENLTQEEKIDFLERELQNSNKEVEFLKKYMPSSERSTIKNKDFYEAIFKAKSDDGEYTEHKLLMSLNLNASGYYRYVRNSVYRYNKYLEDLRIVADIQYISNKYNNKYGYRQIKMTLDRAYIKYGLELVNHKRIIRLMRLYNINCEIRRKSPYRKIWKATKEDKVAPNILERNFKDAAPRTILLTDITYLSCRFGTVYLSAVKDSVTNEIIAYTVKNNLGISLSLDILDQLQSIELSLDAFIHSDQGVHYTSKQFRDKLNSMDLMQSMSRRGNCLDNAPMESFFGHFKNEVDYKCCPNLEDLVKMIDEYMIYYNGQRMQWTLEKLTPIEYRCQLIEKSA